MAEGDARKSAQLAAGSRSGPKSAARAALMTDDLEEEGALSPEADLSGYPILRMDEIGIIPSDVLERAERDVPELLASMHREARKEGRPVAQLAFYLQKQMAAMRSELVIRAAGQRVNALLKGAEVALTDIDGLLNNHRSERGGGAASVLAATTTTTTTGGGGGEGNMRSNRPQSEGFKPLPLPSEMKIMMPHRSLSATTKRSSAFATNTRSPSRSPRVDELGEAEGEGDEASAISGESSGRRRRGAGGGNTSDEADIDSASDAANTSRSDRAQQQKKSRGGRFRKPKPQAFVKEMPVINNPPTQKAMEAVFKNFGSQFVVAATERKTRYLPKKKEVVESVEDSRERERLERRKAAMTRLMERREKQQSGLLKRKEMKLQESSSKAQLRAQARASSGGGGGDKKASSLSANETILEEEESSDCESISGGEDEAPVEVDAALVKAVEKAFEEEVRRSPRKPEKESPSGKSPSSSLPPISSPSAADKNSSSPKKSPLRGGKAVAAVGSDNKSKVAKLPIGAGPTKTTSISKSVDIALANALASDLKRQKELTIDTTSDDEKGQKRKDKRSPTQLYMLKAAADADAAAKAAKRASGIPVRSKAKASLSANEASAPTSESEREIDEETARDSDNKESSSTAGAIEIQTSTSTERPSLPFQEEEEAAAAEKENDDDDGDDDDDDDASKTEEAADSSRKVEEGEMQEPEREKALAKDVSEKNLAALSSLRQMKEKREAAAAAAAAAASSPPPIDKHKDSPTLSTATWRLSLDEIKAQDLFDLGSSLDKQDPMVKIFFADVQVGQTARQKDAGNKI